MPLKCGHLSNLESGHSVPCPLALHNTIKLSNVDSHLYTIDFRCKFFPYSRFCSLYAGLRSIQIQGLEVH